MTIGSQPAGKDTPAPEQRSARLSVAALRSAAPGRMWGGKGCGAPCDFCRVVVNPEEIEYEVEARVGDETLILHFHPRCHDAWSESRESSAEPASREPKSRSSAPAE
jgi:hypothetical protein